MYRLPGMQRHATAGRLKNIGNIIRQIRRIGRIYTGNTLTNVFLPRHLRWTDTGNMSNSKCLVFTQFHHDDLPITSLINVTKIHRDPFVDRRPVLITRFQERCIPAN